MRWLPQALREHGLIGSEIFDRRPVPPPAMRAMRWGEAFNDGQMNVVESIEAVPEEYGYIHEMKADADALGVASHVVDAIVHAVQAATEMVDANSGLASPDAVFESVIATGNAAHLAVDGANGYAEFHSDIEEDSEEEIETPPHISAFWKAVERDAIHLEASTDQEGKTGAPVEDLSKSALWLDGIPIWASRRWADFKDDLPSGEGWRVWTDWYEARLVGQPGNPAQEYERVTVSEEDLKQGPAQANAAIADLVTTSDRQLNDKESKLLGNREYQVALSFAGEQRDYVDAVAQHLAARSIAVFYDGFEQAGLWGRGGGLSRSIRGEGHVCRDVYLRRIRQKGMDAARTEISTKSYDERRGRVCPSGPLR